MKVVTLTEVERLIERRKWILSELRKLEEKYKMTTSEFISKWKRGLIPEPDDPEVHGDFIVWEALADELRRVENELKRRLG